MSAPPGRDRGLEAPGALFRQPDGAAAQIRLDEGDLDEPGLLETAQVAGQGRLVEPDPLRQGADAVVAGSRDMGHEAELGDAQAGRMHPRLQEARDPTFGHADAHPGAGLNHRARIADQPLAGTLPSVCLVTYDVDAC